MFNKSSNWTVIYDDGHEQVIACADVRGNLTWEQRDSEGALETIKWQAKTPAAVIGSWLESHHIDYERYPKGHITMEWERCLATSKTVGQVVETARRSAIAI